MVAPVETTPEIQENEEKCSKTLMAEGRRDFICKDYSNAAENFSKACEKLTVEFGDRASETADGYFWYGKALLETSRNQQDFLGTKAENEDVENQDPKDGQKSPVEELKKPLEKIDEDLKNDAEKEGKTQEAEEEPTKEDLGEEDSEEEEEDITDQQLAYEMFEMARGIYETLMESTQATEINRAECHMSIGEINGENGQIEEAIEEYYAALDILVKKLPQERKRRLAEVYRKV